MNSQELLRLFIRKEITKQIREAYGVETIQFATPGGFEQMHKRDVRNQRFVDIEKWKITAKQLGATVKDRDDDLIAILPNEKILGTYNKLSNFGSLLII